MPHSYTNLVYHVVFSTKDRMPMLDHSVRSRLCDYLGSIVDDRGGSLVAANGVADHIHLLARLSQKQAVAEAVRDLKANSSRWLKQTFRETRAFGWQTGYGAFTVSESQIARVTTYIANQQAHHERVSFREEFVRLLKAHNVAFDERYLDA
jgi:putative transposase